MPIPRLGLPEQPGDYALLQAQERGEYAAAEPSGDGGLLIRIIQRVASEAPGGPVYLMQGIYPLPPNITALTSNIEEEYHRYRNVSYLRSSLKQSFALILSLVLLMTVLVAILAALTAARRMVAQLAEALDHAHNRGLVHRSLQPDVVHVDAEGRAVISGFGRSLAWEPGSSGVSGKTSRSSG